MRNCLRLSILTTILFFTPCVCLGVILEEFKSAYDALQRQVLDRNGEVADIDSFTYVKDVATFSFGKGVMLLQRPVNGRPTLAAFVGRGHVHIDVPVETERRALEEVAKDTVIDDSFQVCFMRIGDDFDLKLRERFSFVQGLMGNAEFTKVRDAQGEYYFKPTLFDLYDNLTELAVSTFERKDDGYFWACVNNKVFLFDPYRPEEVDIACPQDLAVSTNALGPRFQRKEHSRYPSDQLSDMEYQTSVIKQDARLEMGGADGWAIQKAEIRSRLVVNGDSLRFFSMFLDKHLVPDSIWCNGRKIDWFRRYEFFHLLFLLPEYAHRGDTLNTTIWFHNGGEDYSIIWPFFENPTLFPRQLQLAFPNGYNYAAPAQGQVVDVGNGMSQCVAGPVESSGFWFQPLPTGYDTLVRLIDSNFALVFVRPKARKILEKPFEDTTVDACKYFLDCYGFPSHLNRLFVFPRPEKESGGYTVASALGFFSVRPSKNSKDVGGLYAAVANVAANAWFGPTFHPASYRELWMREAVPEYMAILYVQKRTGNGVLFSELNGCRDGIANAMNWKYDVPLAACGRTSSDVSLNRGTWLLHMLRALMFDLHDLNDDKFLAFLKDVVAQGNDHRFSNADFCHLAEQHFGGPLDWFFASALYDCGLPSFQSTWKSAKDSDGYYVDLHVVTTGVKQDNVYPVMLRVILPKGSALMRQAIAGQKTDYKIGPFKSQPTNLVFNEYESVLCRSSIKKL